MISRQTSSSGCARGRRSALTLVSAPAGFGKTTLLAEWVDDPRTPRRAWLSADRADADPVRLWAHAITSLAEVDPQVGLGSLAALRAGAKQIESRVLAVLFEELAGDGPDLVLIIDDYHLAHATAVDSSIDAFIR